MDVTPYLSPIVAVVIAIVGSYIAMKNVYNTKFEELHVQIAELSTKIDGLTSQVDKHNNVIERTYKLETEMSTAFRRIDELRERDEKLESKINR